LGLVVAGCLAMLTWVITLDRRGTFHNTAGLDDLDGDGDLDVFLHNIRNESEFTAFSVATLWLNQGGGRLFTMDPDDDTPNYSWVWINVWDENKTFALF
jgi:hypothetical protein